MSLDCPRCGRELSLVPRSDPNGWFNDDQYMSMCAGDWYCVFCPPNDRSKKNLYCYWWDSEVRKEADGFKFA